MTKLTKENIVAKIKRNNTNGVLAALHCANACRHLIKYERSLKAIDVAMNLESYSKEDLYKICMAAAEAAEAAAYDAWSAVCSDYYTAREVSHADAADAITVCFSRKTVAAIRIADAAEAAAEAAFAVARAVIPSYFAIAASWFADHAANAIYSAAKALNDDKVIESIIDKYLPL